MAQYQHLPIYKQTYDILLRTMVAPARAGVLFQKSSPAMRDEDFPREYKYSLGQKLLEAGEGSSGGFLAHPAVT